ncbi:MAG: arginine--tRNA ligase [Gemmatimonadota bacterium]|jgi:arginyl-tRNA synthetase
MSETLILQALAQALTEMGVDGAEVHLERPRDPSHGDWATNVALTLSKTLRRPPRDIAEEIAGRLDMAAAGADRVEVAGPGFLNFHLSAGAIAGALGKILALDARFGRGPGGDGQPIMVEFVSANPTGPLHLGHGRQAALGDAISTLLEWTDWAVHREYYYNDAGKQIDLLAQSVRARYQQLLGEDLEVPEGGYQGTYVTDVAKALVEEEGDRLKGDESPEAAEFIRLFAVRVLREDQDRDLAAFHLYFDEYYLESSLYTDGRVDATVQALKKTGLVYEKDGAIWLRTTEYGDQKDRVMVRSDGNPTYFLPDVAYHMTKWERGFRHVINVQGADHHSTVTRVRAGLQTLGLPEGYPEYVLHQMVTVEREGKEVKFSKRAGSYTTLRELVEEVGVDVARYFFLMRKPDAHLVFDLDVALDQSEKNPVYKVQYAHARMCSIFRKAGISEGEIEAEGAPLHRLSHTLERDLIKRLDDFPETVRRAAATRSPHTLCDYLEQTAGAVNSWYHAGNPSRDPELAVLVGDPSLRRARLVLARAVRIVLRNGLEILGVSAPTRMERAEEVEDV